MSPSNRRSSMALPASVTSPSVLLSTFLTVFFVITPSAFGRFACNHVHFILTLKHAMLWRWATSGHLAWSATLSPMTTINALRGRRYDCASFTPGEVRSIRGACVTCYDPIVKP
eukprot:CAMPEP_0185158872 /NCGR_PEP_ID=MMETSP1139-20130426/2684_1 /TAXON_ID=298111 /ORGANISM="Pavlova sp., Strain CCMP459" /LENGTH=113 /DNA_ID=CAMNT_0027724025 /DNA_START=161 /DNA_END=502 /DNA_ORIENTATION=+